MNNYILSLNIERWLLSSNAKDTGVLYLIFALSSGIWVGIIELVFGMLIFI
jgi:heme/copper-type cytochrome/quinol oxidase subunit 1